MNVLPLKEPTKYCTPDPPAAEPELVVTGITHLTFEASLSNASGNRSGLSQGPACAPTPETSLR